VENLYIHLEQSLLASGFLDPANPKTVPHRHSRRAALSAGLSVKQFVGKSTRKMSPRPEFRKNRMMA